MTADSVQHLHFVHCIFDMSAQHLISNCVDFDSDDNGPKIQQALVNSNSNSPVHMLGTNNPKLCLTGETKEVVHFDCFPAHSGSTGTLARALSTLSPSLATASAQSTTAGAASIGMALFPPGTVLGKRTLAPFTAGLVLKTVEQGLWRLPLPHWHLRARQGQTG